MRFSTREITDQQAIEAFLHTARTGYLGLTDGVEPYVIPLNFIWHQNTIYFHGANAGRKVRIIEKNNHACFTLSDDLGTICHPVPAHTDTAYKSAIVFGKVKKVEDVLECTEVMQKMLEKYVPGYYDRPLSSSHVEKYQSSLGSRTVVYQLIPEKITGKENPLQEENKFTPGRTVQMDRNN